MQFSKYFQGHIPGLVCGATVDINSTNKFKKIPLFALASFTVVTIKKKNFSQTYVHIVFTLLFFIYLFSSDSRSITEKTNKTVKTTQIKRDIQKRIYPSNLVF